MVVTGAMVVTDITVGVTAVGGAAADMPIITTTTATTTTIGLIAPAMDIGRTTATDLTADTAAAAGSTSASK